MNFESYIVSETKTATSLPLQSPPPYSDKDLGLIGFCKQLFKNRVKLPNRRFKKLNILIPAFTLAEVLITLTIIGVIAAMTLPTLMSKYQNRTYVTGLKKAYSVLQNAVKMLPIEQGCPAGDYNCVGLKNNNDSNLQIISKVMKAKIFRSDAYKVEGLGLACNIIENNSNNCYMTDDGMIFFSYSDPRIAVDVNGVKGPNKWGRDLFLFDVIFSGSNDFFSYGYCQNLMGTVVPAGKTFDVYNCSIEDDDAIIQNCLSKPGYPDFFGCTAKVLNEDAINY